MPRQFHEIGESPVKWGNKLDSRLEGRGFKSCPILDEVGFKVMPGSIRLPNPSSIIKKEQKERECMWVSISSTFFARVFCTKFLAQKFQTQKPKSVKLLAPKICTKNALMKLTVGRKKNIKKAV